MGKVWEIRIKGEMFGIRCFFKEDVPAMVEYYRKLGKITSEEDYTITERKMEIEPRWDIYANDYED